MEKGFWQSACLSLLLLPISAFAGTMVSGLPGDGNVLDPTYYPGIVYSLGSITTAGDVIICNPTAPTCSTSIPTSDWTDVLVFYYSGNGPYIPDATVDADSAYVFFDDTSGPFGGLPNFLANYGGELSSNATALYEGQNGVTDYGGYIIINSSVPEPSGFLLVGPILIGLAGFVRYRAAAH